MDLGEKMTAKDLDAWLTRAPAGASIVYYRGSLASDAHAPPLAFAWDHERSDWIAELRTLRRLAWDWQEADMVHLVQRRHGDDDYDYIAVRR